MDSLRHTAHRPWSLPAGPWVMAQNWHDLLFAHWPVAIDELRALIPPELSIDTFEGRAWIGVVPFRMSGVRLRLTPSLPWFSAFPELNLRTYVTLNDKPGVYFFALDATNPIAVAIARRWFHLPYFNARMQCEHRGEAIEYRSERTHAGAPPALVEARYEPIAPVELARRGTLEHWFTERYCLYTVARPGTVARSDIHHLPWPLQRARARFTACSLPRAHGLSSTAGEPHVLFARRLDVVVWPPRRVSV